MEQPFQFTADAEGARLDVFLAKASSRSREFAQEQISAGRVQIAGGIVTKASRRLKSGESVSGVFVETAPPELTPVERALEVLYEDEAFLVLNKEQGVVIHPAVGHRGDTLVHHLLHYFSRGSFSGNSAFAGLSETRPGIVHRLDRGTSGLLLVAKDRTAQETLSAQFKARTIKKEYEAIVWNPLNVPSGTCADPLGRDRRDRKRMSSRTDDPRPALTRWTRARDFLHFAHVQLFPETGRTHQLRVHLSEAAHPVVGDDLYGLRTQGRRDGLPMTIRTALDGTVMTFLHARKLTLQHPRTEALMHFEAPRPANFEAFLKLLSTDDR